MAMPIIFLLMAGLYLAFAVIRAPNSSFAFWVSMFPFFAPITMMVRIVSQTPPVLADRFVARYWLPDRVAIALASVENLSHRYVDVWEESFDTGSNTLGAPSLERTTGTKKSETRA